MPDPTGVRIALLGQVRTELARARPHLMEAARAADEAHAPELHRQIMATVAQLDDSAEEVDPQR
jgi:hypothetical protein